jgi:hypothetical protein
MCNAGARGICVEPECERKEESGLALHRNRRESLGRMVTGLRAGLCKTLTHLSVNYPNNIYSTAFVNGLRIRALKLEPTGLRRLFIPHRRLQPFTTESSR